VKVDRRGNGEERREVCRPGVNAALNAGGRRFFIPHHPVDVGEALLADIQHADADRSADPLVQVEADEIASEVADGHVHLADRVRRVENDVRAASARHRGDLR
jgi:hypothetical protein